MEVSVFVVVVAYKGMRWYERCFESLRHSSIRVKIVVVDNASNDGTVEYIRKNYPEIHLIESERNLGFGRANNLGMRYALDHNCDYVLLLNQDTWVEPEAIELLVKCHLSHREYGIISPMHMSPNRNHLNFLLDDGNRNYELLSDLYCGTVKDVYSIIYVNAAAWLLPRITLEKIGGFCPIIFHYGEDDDYVNRVRFHRYKIGLCPSARIIHDNRNALGEAAALFKKANIDKIDEYLDITKPVDLNQLRRYYLRKVLLSFVRKQVVERKYYYDRYKFIKTHQSEIEECRKQNKQLKSNWL
jgi:GT2 family glycosyltransferase